LTLGLGEGPGCETVALRSLAGSHDATDVPLIAGALVGRGKGEGGKGKRYSELWYLTAAGSPGSRVQIRHPKPNISNPQAKKPWLLIAEGHGQSTSQASDHICVMVQGLKIFPLEWPQFEKSHTFLFFGCIHQSHGFASMQS
jgi:hypothetical protein